MSQDGHILAPLERGAPRHHPHTPAVQQPTTHRRACMQTITSARTRVVTPSESPSLTHPAVARVRDPAHRAAPPSTLTYPCPPRPPPHPLRPCPRAGTSFHPTHPRCPLCRTSVRARTCTRTIVSACTRVLAPSPSLRLAHLHWHPPCRRTSTRALNIPTHMQTATRIDDRVALPRAARLARQISTM
ncbi:hypothetical protein HD554DRAFT_1745278 [Boletus coccyginus]|nr:hypothetical protein HD554DRAFT_1745278 [Boletus coccyginus]